LQVPADVALSDPLVIEQPDAVPFAAEYVTAPSPAPPVVVRESGVPNVPDVLVTVNVGCVVRTGVRVWVPATVEVSYKAFTV
jgi:hypothetical protein